MVSELLEVNYESKSDKFILPFTKLQKNICKSYMFWEEHSIEDYKLILEFEYGDEFMWGTYDKFLIAFNNQISQVLNRHAPVIESYDFKCKTILVIDLSEWAFDIDQILNGKYSKISKSAKECIKIHHIKKDRSVGYDVYCVIYPKDELPILDGMDAITYAAYHYELPYDVLSKVGEIGRIYDKEKETLTLKLDEICQDVVFTNEV